MHFIHWSMIHPNSRTFEEIKRWTNIWPRRTDPAPPPYAPNGLAGTEEGGIADRARMISAVSCLLLPAARATPTSSKFMHACTRHYARNGPPPPASIDRSGRGGDTEFVGRSTSSYCTRGRRRPGSVSLQLDSYSAIVPLMKSGN